MSLEPEAEEILAYWFSGDAEERKKRWWMKNEATDHAIRERFGALSARAAGGAFDGWASTARGALALTLLLDQVPRTIHRGSPASWACDAKAREVVGDAIAAGRHEELDPGPERMFLLMPLVHSERIADQDESIRLCTEMHALQGESGPPSWAVQHMEIVKRFGRFPHRNAVLGRESTPEETAFLTQPGSSF